jgi:hypothetical protein
MTTYSTENDDQHPVDTTMGTNSERSLTLTHDD